MGSRFCAKMRQKIKPGFFLASFVFNDSGGLCYYCGTAAYLAGEQIDYERMQESEYSMTFAQDVWDQLNGYGMPFEQEQTM